MKNVVYEFFFFVTSTFKSRIALQLEILALHHQLSVYKHSKKRPKIRVSDRMFWIWLSRCWAGSVNSLVFVKPETLIKWQRKRFRDHWAKLSQGKPGRPKVDKEIRDLIRRMSEANPYNQKSFGRMDSPTDNRSFSLGNSAEIFNPRSGRYLRQLLLPLS